MNTTQTQKKDGFTIIEVVLVLAIGALIMLLVFLAWPALQRGQRDQARNSDVSLLASTIGTWKTNNKGKVPSTASELTSITNDLSLSQYDSTDVVYNAGGSTTVAPASDIQQIRYVRGHKCDDTGGGTTKAGGRQAALQYMVEGSGSELAQCRDI